MGRNEVIKQEIERYQYTLKSNEHFSNDLEEEKRGIEKEYQERLDRVNSRLDRIKESEFALNTLIEVLQSQLQETDAKSTKDQRSVATTEAQTENDG